MPENAEQVSLTILLETDASCDADQVDLQARRLRQQLREFDVDSVELGRGGSIPAGAKAGEVVALGTVLLTLAPAVLPKVIDFLQAWILRGSGRSVKIHAASGGTSFDVEYFARRHL